MEFSEQFKSFIPEDAAPLTIYIAEDDTMILDLLRINLFKRGWTVETFTSGEQLLARQQEAPAEIIITDYRMGGISGLETLGSIREKWPASEVILMSGFATVELAVSALRQGAYDMLTKPIDYDQMDAVLRRCAKRIHFVRENRELRRVVDRLQELNSQKEKFLALTNHELRTPTTVMVGMLRLLEKRAAGLDQPIQELIRGASQAAVQLASAVKDLGMLATMRGGDIILKPSNCNLGELCTSISGLAENYRALRSLEITVTCPEADGAKVFVDYKKVERAIAALLQNAVKFTPDGGKIEVAVARKGGDIQITVADNGVGVPEGEEEKIFQLFYAVADENLHHSSAYEFGGGGMGVGLTLVEAIAHAHGGSVAFSPREGGGSLFTLSIPATG